MQVHSVFASLIDGSGIDLRLGSACSREAASSALERDAVVVLLPPPAP